MGERLRVALRADASPQIGLGHVARCLALAEALQDCGAEVRLVSRALGTDVSEIARAAGVETLRLPAPAPGTSPDPDGPAHARWAGVSAAQDARETAVHLAAWQPHWLVVDHYAFDAHWHRAACAELDARLLVIDDLADRELDAALLLDPNLAADHRAKYAGHWPPDRPLLGGPRFALLGRRYADAPRHDPHDAVRSIGVFLGGADAAGLSAPALAACDAAGFDGPVEVVSTRTNPHLAALREACARRPRTTLTVDAPELSGFFARHDLQIGAAGGASWERCCIGAPTLALLCADNQRAVLPQLAALGAIEAPLSDMPATAADWARIAAALRALLHDAPRRAALAARSRTLVDGLGARRAALRLAAAHLQVRPATLEDAQRMHRWRNHPATRAASVDDREIPWADHLAWLQHALADPRRTLLVGQIGTVAVGVIRFDRRDEDAAEVSLYLDPALHGLGLGGALLHAGEARMASVGIFHATVLQDNLASQRLFAAAGYRRSDERHWLKDRAEPLPHNPAP